MALGALLVATGWLALAFATTPQANALSCAGPPPGETQEEVRQQARERADFIFRGVALSGPRDLLELVAPVRMHVVNYLKGNGPRTLRLNLGAPQVFPGDLTYAYSSIAGLQYLLPGDGLRIFAQVVSRHPLVVSTSGPCGYDRYFDSTKPMSRIGSLWRDGPGDRRWHAREFSRRDGLRCLSLGIKRRFPGPVMECARPSTRPKLAVDATRVAGANSSAVAISAKGLTEAEISTADATVTRQASEQGAIAIATFPYVVDHDDVRVLARFRDGSERVVGTEPVAAHVPDPVDVDRRWEAVSERGIGRYEDLVCVRWEEVGGYDLRHGECGRLQKPFFYALRRQIDYRDDEVERRVLFGRLGDSVTSITITTPDGPVPVGLADRGGAFIAVLTPDVIRRDITVDLTFSDRPPRSFTGEGEVNLAPVPDVNR